MDVRTFFHWWFEQLRTLVPGRFSAGGAGHRDALLLSLNGDGIAVAVRRGQVTAAVGRFVSGGDPAAKRFLHDHGDLARHVLLRPDPTQVLRKNLTLPASAARDLRRVLSFELERETPFSSQEVFWDIAIRGRSADGARIDVEVAMVPKITLARLAARAREAGFLPVAVEIPIDDTHAGVVPLDGEAASRERDPWLRPLVIATAALGLLAVVIPWAVQQYRISSLETRLASAREAAMEAANLRQQIDRLSGRADFLVAERGRSVGALAALAATTRTLPDDSYLQALSLRGDRMTVRGYSPRAADLILRFADSPDFRDPAFQSPVVRTNDGKMESFAIGAAMIATEPSP